MAVTKLIVWNMALSYLGEHLLDDTTTPNKNQKILDQFWEIAYQSCLQESTWNFATTRAALVDSGTTPDDWGYEYDVPSDMLRPIDVSVVGVDNLRLNTNTGAVVKADFTMRTRAGTRYIYTDLASAYLRYIYDPGNDNDTDMANWTYPFAEFVAARLARYAAIPITGKSQEQDRMMRVERPKLDSALGLDVSSQRTSFTFESRYTIGGH